MKPSFTVYQLVWAIADGMFAERLYVFVGDAGQWHIGNMSEAEWETCLWLVESNGKAQRACDGEAAHMTIGVVFGDDVLVAVNGAEETLVELHVFTARTIVPGVYIALRGHGFTVAEGPAGFQSDGELSGVAVRLNRLGVGQHHFPVVVVADKAAEEVEENVPAAYFICVGGNEGVLWFGPVDANDTGGGGVIVVAAAGEGSEASGEEECAGASGKGTAESP